MNDALAKRIVDAVLASAFTYHGQVVGFERGRVEEAVKRVLAEADAEAWAEMERRVR